MTNKISERIKLGETDIYVSPVGFGVLPMGPGQLALPVETGAELIVYALEQGINFIDTAQYYRTHGYIRRALEMLEAHRTEACPQVGEGSGAPLAGARAAADASMDLGRPPAFGACAERRARAAQQDQGRHGRAARATSEADVLGRIGSGERPVISSKTLATDYEQAAAAIEEERRALGVECIDIFLLHELRSGQFAERHGAWRALQDAKAAGKVRAIGASTHHVDVVEELASVPACDIIFPLINYAGMGIRRGRCAATAADMEQAIAKASAAGKGIYTMKALGGGNLAAHYQEALNYAFSRQGVSSVMLGFGCRHDIDDIVSYLDGTMSPDYNPDVSSKRVRVNHEDCEGCGTCIPVCASGAISFSDADGLAVIDQSRCVTCGYCAQACPVRAIIMY